MILLSPEFCMSDYQITERTKCNEQTLLILIDRIAMGFGIKKKEDTKRKRGFEARNFQRRGIHRDTIIRLTYPIIIFG